MFIPGWIPDLSRGDSLMQLPFLVPIVNWGELRLLPIIYVVSQLLFSKVTQTPTATAQKGSMKFMMYGMPLMFFFLFYNAPAGLLLYWTFSNILTLGQQVVINKMMHAKKELSLVSK
jgi:YidC/Oxa1 family membrane protein insertase